MKKYLYILLLGGMFLQSCENFEQVVDLDVPVHEPKLVVNALMENNTDFVFLHVAKSAGILEEFDNSVVEGVTVNMYDNDQLLDLTWQIDTVYGSNNGGNFVDLYYSTNAIIELGLPGHDYKIEVNSANLGTATVIEKMPSTTNIDNIRLLDKFNLDIDGDTLRYLEVEFNDEVDVDNFYYIEAESYKNGFGSMIYLETRDPSVEADGEGFTDEIIFNDGLFDGINKKIEMSFYSYNDFLNNTDSIVLNFTQMNKTLFEFRIFSKNNDLENPFSEPVILKSNVENGYGVFGLANTQNTTLIL